jgi:hypothetical protein
VPDDAFTDAPADAFNDAFGTAGIRRRVLDAWAASPARFREDANAEEDYALGGYRDRAVVELAQNAADAAARSGVPGRLALTLRDGVLTAANTGAPLDATGVESLCTLRASGKRGEVADEQTVGRFGVGFAAVAAVCDEPRIASSAGGVRWSRSRARALAEGLPALATELRERGGNVPVLRLPFEAGPADGAPPEGFDTVVTLPLRDDAAISLVNRLLAETGPALLLALPALAEVTIEADGPGAGGTVAGGTVAGGTVRVLTAERSGDSVTITVDGTASRWQMVTAGGPLEPALLADRPVEERARPAWSARWAVPLDADGAPARLPASVPAVLHAPTPSDEPLGLPALLLASFPLTPDRRRVAPGPLTGFLVERAADAYARLLPELAAGPTLLDLVPGPMAVGELDVQLRHAILDRLPGLAFLPPVKGAVPTAGNTAPTAGSPARIQPRDALLLDTAAPLSLPPYLADLLPNLISGPSRHPAYATLGIKRLPLAEIADMVATLDRPPSWWRGLYAAMADVDPQALSELGALPVPLTDGRLIRGPRGVLLPGPGLYNPEALVPLRLRMADPDAVHPLLTRLGALEATPRSVLDHPATIAAVDASLDEEDPEPITEAVLGLVQAADVRPGEFPWLADLALPTDDDQWDPAGDLLLPGGELAEVVADDADFGVVDPELVERFGPQVLEAVGVLGSFGLLTASDVDFSDTDFGDEPTILAPDDEPANAADLDLDGADDWSHSVRARFADATQSPAAPPVPPIAVEISAVRDLELVDPARWPRALEILTTRPRLRAALLKPTRVRLPDGTVAGVPSYTAWWLGTHPVLDGHRPADLRAVNGDPLLEGLYDDAAELASTTDPAIARLLADKEVTRALGVRALLDDLLAEPGGPDELLDRLADPVRPVTRRQLRSLWLALAAAAGEQGITPPDRVRAIQGDQVVVADAADVLVLDSPDLWPLVATRPLVLAPYDLSLVLSELLDIPVASQEAPGRVESVGERRAVPEIVRSALPDAPETYLAHDKLIVDGETVPWRCADGEVHASAPGGSASPQALASGLAWASGQWSARHLLTTLLSDPAESPRLQAEADLDAP